MFDKSFDEPNFGSDYDSYGEYDSNKKDFKKYLPLIIIGIVAIVIIGFVLMFFGSQKEVTFNIKELDGGSVSNATLTIRSGNVIIYEPKQGSTHTMTLMVGEYTYTVLSPEHDAKRNEILIVDDKMTETVTLEKNIDATLRVLEGINKIYYGQKLSGKILVDEIQLPLSDQEIVASDSEELLKISLNPNKISAQSGAITIDYEIEVTNNNFTKSTDTTLTFSLKGTKKASTKDSFVINVNPTIRASELEETKREKNKLITDTDLVAGEEKQIELKFKNTNKNINVENVSFEIIPDSGYEDHDWEIYLTGNGIINKIEANKGEETIQLRVKPAITANVGDEFKGKLIVSSNSLEENKEYLMILKVSSAVGVSLELTNTNLPEIDCGYECGNIRTSAQSKPLTLENNGNIEATDVRIELDYEMSLECRDWFDIISSSFDEIEAGGERILDIKIQPLFITETKTTPCYLKITYVDPTKTGRQLLSDTILRIETDYTEPK
ncbi:MAG: hypothetical protein PHP82_00285 [Candidatus ainarchaeum sp.]|nr:hypothetical protein [Candidatus ainarchaeum sp.]